MSTLYKKYNLYIYTNLECKIKQKNIYDILTYTLLHPLPLSFSLLLFVYSGNWVHKVDLLEQALHDLQVKVG